MRLYELFFIVHPQVDDITAIIDAVKNLVARVGGEVVQVEPWGMRRLAYPIRRQVEGQYVLMRLNLVPTSVAELERSVKMIEQVLRYQIVHLEEEAEAAKQSSA